MWEPFEIKKEKTDLLDKALVCTCESEVKEKVQNLNKVRQVLVNFGLNRKKVFTLNEKNENLYEQFKNHILSEPAFSELLEDSYVIFQEFSEKFETWVDIDVNEKLKDGTVLNAVFFPNNIERDESNPGCIKKKEILFVAEKVKKKRSLDVIHVDLTDDLPDNTVKRSKHSKNGKSSKVRMEEQNNGEETKEENLIKNEKKVRSSAENIDELKKEGEGGKEEQDLKNNEKKSKKVRSSNVIKDEVRKEEEIEHNIKKNKVLLKKKRTKTLSEVNDSTTGNSELKNKETSGKKKKCVKKNYISVKTNVILTEESSQNVDESKSLNQQKISEQEKHLYQEVSKHSPRKHDLHLTSHHNVHGENHSGSYCSYPEIPDNFQAPNKDFERKNENKSTRNLVQNGNSFVTEIYNMCAERDWPDPVFVIKEDPLKGFLCELKLKNTTFYKEHSDSSQVKEAVAELAINRLKEEENSYSSYNTQYWGSWQRNSRRPFQRSPPFPRGSRRPYQRSHMRSWRNE